MDISVIIPTFKPREYLWECLDSLKEQNIEKEKYEILIILNGEKEPYYSQILNYINKNNLLNFKLFYVEVSGVSNARNFGLDISKGKNIIFIDDDDYISKNYLKTLNTEVEENSIVVSNMLIFDDLTKLKLENKIEFIENNHSKDIIKSRENFGVVWRKIIPKNIIGTIRFKKELKNSEDAIFMLEISKNIKVVKNTSKKIVYYRRVRKDSAHFRQKMRLEIAVNFLIQFKYMLNFFLRKEYNKKFIFIRLLGLIKGSINRFFKGY